VVSRQNADTADTVHLRGVAMATIFLAFYIWMHIGATWRIRLNRPCAAAMRPCVKLLWPLVYNIPAKRVHVVQQYRQRFTLPAVNFHSALQCSHCKRCT